MSTVRTYLGFVLGGYAIGMLISWVWAWFWGETPMKDETWMWAYGSLTACSAIAVLLTHLIYGHLTKKGLSADVLLAIGVPAGAVCSLIVASVAICLFPTLPSSHPSELLVFENAGGRWTQVGNPAHARGWMKFYAARFELQPSPIRVPLKGGGSVLITDDGVYSCVLDAAAALSKAQREETGYISSVEIARRVQEYFDAHPQTLSHTLQELQILVMAEYQRQVRLLGYSPQ